jgi:hypothetical protein
MPHSRRHRSSVADHAGHDHAGHDHAGHDHGQLVGNAATLQDMLAREGQGSSAPGSRQELQRWAGETLKGRFSLLQPGQERTAGNQVTQEEFNALTRMFADIYAGRSDLQVDHSALSGDERMAFRMGFMDDLAAILQTQSGRDLVGALHDGPSAGFLRGDTKTFVERNGGMQPDPSNAFGGRRTDGTGVVSYVPGAMHGPDRNLRSDVTLYHELVHAYHGVYDSWDTDTVVRERGGAASDIGRVGESEYQAVGLGEHANARFSENRYRMERRAIGAQDHGERRGDDTMAYRDSYLGFDD